METERQAYSIENFCKTHDLSRSAFYDLQKVGKAPAIMRVGRRVLISAEAAREWREKMQSQAAAA